MREASFYLRGNLKKEFQVPLVNFTLEQLFRVMIKGGEGLSSE